MKYNLEKWALRIGIATLIGVTFMSGAPVYALSADQINALNSGVYYFNTEVDCGGIQTTTSTTTVTLTGTDNEQKAFNYFISKGLNATAAAATVGNLMEESHLDPTITQGGGDTQDPSTVTGGATGWGIAQWTPGAKIIGIAQGLHITGPIYQLATQLDIVWAEMTGSAPTGFQDVATGLKQQTNLSDATSYFQVHFESGTNFAARYQLAQQAFQLYGASAQATTTNSGGLTTTATQTNTNLPANCTSTATTTTTGTPGSGKDIIWLQSGPSAEFDGVCNGCTDPKTGITDYWISGQCAQASLAEVLNAYKQGVKMHGINYPGTSYSMAPTSTGGVYYKTIDVERIGEKAGVWAGEFLFKPSQQASWDIEAGLFKMKDKYQTLAATNDNVMNSELGNLINDANAGTPVITNAPNHWLVIIGGDAQYVDLLDSSGHNNTWAPASTSDSTTVSSQPFHVAGQVDLGHTTRVLRSTFIHGLSNYQNYWGGTEAGTANGGIVPAPVSVELTPQ